MEPKQADFGHDHLQFDRTDFAAYSWQSTSNSSRNRTTIFAGAPTSNTARVAPVIAEYNISATKSISPIVAPAASASAAVSARCPRFDTLRTTAAPSGSEAAAFSAVGCYE
jgi:hypothetical protein